MSDQLLTGKKGAAEMLNVSVRTIDRMISEGILPSVRVRGSVRIPLDAVKKIAEGEKPRDAKDKPARTWRPRNSDDAQPVEGGPHFNTMQLV